MTKEEPMKTSKDSCPAWASEKIDQLRQIEIFLGNIPKALEWQSDHVKDVAQRSFHKEEQVFDDEKAELVFRRIVRGLHQEGYSSQQIAEFINARIGYKGAPPYCSAQEVEEAL